MTKAETKAMRANWRKALEDGRVVRVNETTMKSYPTKAMRDAAIDEMHKAGLTPAIVNPNDETAITF